MRLKNWLIIKTAILSSACASKIVDPGPKRIVTPCRLDLKTMRYECYSSSKTPAFYMPVAEAQDFVCYPPENIQDLVR